MPDVFLSGDQTLLRRINALAGPIQRKVYRKASREALRPTLAAARRLVKKRTRRLEKSIKLRATKRNRKGKVGARVTTGTATSDFGGDEYYGGFLNWGYKRGKASAGVKAARALKARGGLRASGKWFRERRDRARSKAEAALKADKRTEVPGDRFMNRAADQTKNQAQQIFRDVARRELINETLAVR